jgi:hypothetical protein
MTPAVTHQKRKAKQDLSAFKARLASPTAGNFSLPANARLAIRSVAGCAAGTSIVTIGSRTIKAPALAAGGVHPIGYFERGKAVSPIAGFEMLVDTGLGRYGKIGQG